MTFSHKRSLFILSSFVVFVFSIFFSFNPHPARAYISQFNSSASVVVGQADFTHGTANQGLTVAANTISGPKGVWSSNNKLFVYDRGNCRVLIFNSIPNSNNTSANVVVGQQTFSGSTRNQGLSIATNTLSKGFDIWSDGTKLIIDDGESGQNNRLLIFNSIPVANNASANNVVGMNVFTTKGTGGPTASRFQGNLRGMSSDGQKLLAVDTAAHRVLIWNTIPTSDDAAANVVVGQTNSTNNSSGTSSTKLSSPSKAFSDGKKLFIADTSNNRVLIFNTIPTTNGAQADVVIGQTDFDSGAANRGLPAPTSATLSSPWDLYSDGTRLLIADQGNNRILVYNTIPNLNGASADAVIGQSDFATASNGITQSKFNGLWGLSFNNNKIFVGDLNNNRVLIFNTAPENTSVSIATQASSESSSVTLALSATGAKEMMISNYSDFRDGVWETFATSKDWTLLSGSGDRTVYAKFRDWGNFESDAVSTNGMVALPATGKRSLPIPYLIFPLLFSFLIHRQIRRLSLAKI